MMMMITDSRTENHFVWLFVMANPLPAMLTLDLES